MKVAEREPEDHRKAGRGWFGVSRAFQTHSSLLINASRKEETLKITYC